MTSILGSIKKMLNIEFNDNSFDDELILFINSVFNICFQLGVGPKDKAFAISGNNDSWTDFLPENEINMVKTYIFAKVKLMFDPPTNSFTLSAYQDLVKEFEWRSNVQAETP